MKKKNKSSLQNICKEEVIGACLQFSEKKKIINEWKNGRHYNSGKSRSHVYIFVDSL